jgi:hypothetical protein
LTQRLESSIGAEFVRRMKAAGWLPLKLHGSPHQRQGLPDYLCLPPRAGTAHPSAGRRAVWCELKRPGEEGTPLQKRTAQEIASRGGVVVHCDDAERARSTVLDLASTQVDVGLFVEAFAGCPLVVVARFSR